MRRFVFGHVDDAMTKKIPSALKHGGYSGVTLLPGEDPAAFEALHKALIAEFTPVGCLEEDIIATMARLVWRKQNLLPYRAAEEMQNWHKALVASQFPSIDLGRGERLMAEEQARKQVGQVYDLLEMGEAATLDHLLCELSVVDRLDALIDRCLKRLLFVRGLKSIARSSSTSPAPPHNKRLTAA
jgi:hypothetical protein